MLDHELREARAIDENDLLDTVSELRRIRGEVGCRGEDTLVRTPSSQSIVEALDLGPTDPAHPAFRLHEDLFETEGIERDDPIDATISRTTDVLKVGSARAVPMACKRSSTSTSKNLGLARPIRSRRSRATLSGPARALPR